MYRDGTLHNNMTCIGTEHYIMMWMWNVHGQSINQRSRMWKDGTLHNHKECTKTERYCLHHYSEQLTRTFAVLVQKQYCLILLFWSTARHLFTFAEAGISIILGRWVIACSIAGMNTVFLKHKNLFLKRFWKA